MKTVYSIVVTYNGIEWIDKCLNSLINSLYPTQIIVIDNGSSDTTISFIKTNFKQVQLIETGKNLGFGQANNLGIAEAIKNNADYFFLLNQDAWVETDTLTSLINVHTGNPDYGIISPVHLNGAGTALDAYFLEYLVKSDIRGYLTNSLFKNIDDLPVIETSFVNAAGWLLSKKCIKVVGGFDPIFFHYGEDRNYTQRTLYHGLKIAVDPNSRLFHDREQRISQSSLTLQSQIKKDFINDLNLFCDITIRNYKTLLFKRILKYKCLFVINLIVVNRNKSEYYFKMLKNIFLYLPKIPNSRRNSLSKTGYW